MSVFTPQHKHVKRYCSGGAVVCLTYSWYIHQALAKPISQCQNGACGILSPWEAVTVQVPFHYTLSGQSLLLPLYCPITLFISLVCTGGFHIAGFSLSGSGVNVADFEYYWVSNVLKSGELPPPLVYFHRNVYEPYVCCIFVVKRLFHCEIFE